MLKPFNTTKLKNGWTVKEYESQKLFPFVGGNSLGPGKGRFTFDLMRVPSTQTIRVVHYVGTTPKERALAMKVGIATGYGRGIKGLPWTRRKERNGKNWCFSVIMGVPIDAAEEFRRLTQGAHTDDAIELEFQSIVQQIGVSA